MCTAVSMIIFVESCRFSDESNSYAFSAIFLQLCAVLLDFSSLLDSSVWLMGLNQRNAHDSKVRPFHTCLGSPS